MSGLVRPLLNSPCLSPLSALGFGVFVSPWHFQSNVCFKRCVKDLLVLPLLPGSALTEHAQFPLLVLWLASGVTWGTRRVGILTCGFWHSFFFLKIAGSVALSWGSVPLAEAGDSCEQPQAAEVAVGTPRDVQPGAQDPGCRLLLSKSHDTWEPGDVLAIWSDCQTLSLQDEPDPSTPSPSD